MMMMKRTFRAALLATTTSVIAIGAAWAQQAVPPQGSNSDSAPRADNTKISTQVEEIVVTAEKHSERLLDTPVPVTALNADSLIENNQVSIADYFSEVPGLSFNTLNRGESLIALRGITTGGASNPTVGTVIDDIPFGSSTSGGFGFVVPDIDPESLARIEVLRGPQGTLYGASSMGGLIKYVIADPSTDRFTGRVQAGTEAVSNGDGLGYNFSGSVNVPVNDTIAVRASAFSREEPGFINNPVLDLRGVNQQLASGGSFIALWKPVDAFSLKLSALLQTNRRDGVDDVFKEPGFGDLQQNEPRGSGFFNQTTQFYSAIMNANLGDTTLTSLTGYSINTMSDSIPVPSPVAVIPEHLRTEKVSEELRADIPLGSTFDWLVGAFYTDEQTHFQQDFALIDPNTGSLGSLLLGGSFPYDYTEYAVFTDLTTHVTDNFDIQVGLRESYNTQSFSESETGSLSGGSFSLPQGQVHGSSFTYLVTPSYKITPDMLLYARFASGYEPGGPNIVTTIGGFAPGYQPSTTKNYEIGTKGELFDKKVTYDASVYYIDWNDLQITLLDGQNTVTANGSAAKSQGVEFHTTYRPIPGLNIGAWASYDDAVLTKSFPSNSVAYGVPGDRLPYSSRLSGNLTIDDDFPLTDDFMGYVGATAAYVGDRVGIFGATPQRQIFPAYGQLNLRGGVTTGSWTFNLYVNNVANTRGMVTGGINTVNPLAFQYIQPLTVGFSVAKEF